MPRGFFVPGFVVPEEVATTPASAWDHAEIAAAAGADLFLVQSQVSSAHHISTSGRVLSLSDLTGALRLPVLVGNTVSGEAAYQLMHQGAAAILVGVGPGAACTTREVLGIGVPQVSATLEVAAARDRFERETGRHVPIVTDGGMKTGGDIAKAIASGADAVMLGSPFAGALEAPGRGFNWGMAAPSPTLPRGTRIRIGEQLPLEQILFGPAETRPGTQNLAGALRQSMAGLRVRSTGATAAPSSGSSSARQASGARATGATRSPQSSTSASRSFAWSGSG